MSEDEVRHVVLDMGPLKAPGLDGFNGHFFQKKKEKWGIV